MKTEKVSIVTPCYNGEKYLERFLKSILNQSYGNIELIFINDGSTDQTEEIIKKYKEEFDLHNIELTYLFQENAGMVQHIRMRMTEKLLQVQEKQSV